MYRSQNTVKFSAPTASSIRPFALHLKLWAQSLQTAVSSDHHLLKYSGTGWHLHLGKEEEETRQLLLGRSLEHRISLLASIAVWCSGRHALTNTYSFIIYLGVACKFAKQSSQYRTLLAESQSKCNSAWPPLELIEWNAGVIASTMFSCCNMYTYPEHNNTRSVHNLLLFIAITYNLLSTYLRSAGGILSNLGHNLSLDHMHFCKLCSNKYN